PYPCFEQFREQVQSFTGLAAFTTHRPKLRIDGQLEEVSGQFVSGNYFSLLGVRAALGRTLSPADDTVPGRGGPEGLVAVISHNYWTRRFGRDPAVIGKVVQLGNDPVTIIGVMSYDVARRTHEIGIRMALGADAPRVVRLVLRQTMVWVALGVMIGLGAALTTTQWVESLLFGLKPNDPLTIGLAAALLLAVAAVAGYLPARRAARVDPLVALRHE
ncbi:MAG: ABC transporter permease, partial [Burkholderiales bacterium]